MLRSLSLLLLFIYLQVVVFAKEELKHASKLPVPKGRWVDQYGQNKYASWPEKIKNQSDLLNAEKFERADLAASKILPDRDQYQSWNGGPQLKATGFFCLEKLNDKWWFVAPNGHLYYSLGIDCVEAGAHTKLLKPNRDAFIWLPENSPEFADAFKDQKKRSFSFYVCNLIRKWGKNWKMEFDKRAVARCKSWGFTCFANWCDDVFAKSKVPYLSTGPACWELKNVDYIEGDIADSFDPDFESEVFRVAGMLKANRNDSFLVGYFLDNEMPWWNLPYDVLELNGKSPCKQHWLQKLREKYATIAELNKAWGTTATDFETLRWPGDKAPDAAQNDMIEFRGEFAERFYDCWYRGIKSADPNHLVLGSRIPYPMDDVVMACAKHTDVLSFNHYGYDLPEDFDRYYKLYDKPMLIGEYDFDSLDAGLMNAYVPVRNQKERGVGYSYYTENAAAKPYMVGTHYFQYIDEPLTGRGDGETSFNGFVNVADRPYRELVSAARRSNARCYEIHSGKIPPTRQQPQH